MWRVARANGKKNREEESRYEFAKFGRAFDSSMRSNVSIRDGSETKLFLHGEKKRFSILFLLISESKIYKDRRGRKEGRKKRAFAESRTTLLPSPFSRRKGYEKNDEREFPESWVPRFRKSACSQRKGCIHAYLKLAPSERRVSLRKLDGKFSFSLSSLFPCLLLPLPRKEWSNQEEKLKSLLR